MRLRWTLIGGDAVRAPVLVAAVAVAGDPPRVLPEGRPPLDAVRKELRKRISSLSGSALKSPQRTAGIAAQYHMAGGAVPWSPRTSGDQLVDLGAPGAPVQAVLGAAEVAGDYVEISGADVYELPGHRPTPVAGCDRKPAVPGPLDGPARQDRRAEPQRRVGPHLRRRPHGAAEVPSAAVPGWSTIQPAVFGVGRVLVDLLEADDVGLGARARRRSRRAGPPVEQRAGVEWTIRSCRSGIRGL